VPIQSQIQISGDTLLFAVIRLTLVPGDGSEIADGIDVRQGYSNFWNAGLFSVRREASRSANQVYSII